jgi:stage V sporulation protein B
LALSLPATGFSSVFAGYFTAVGRVWKTAAEQFVEQLCRMVLVAAFLTSTAHGDLENECAAVVAAGTLADNLGAAALFFLYLHDRRKHSSNRLRGHRLTPRMLSIAFPLALSAYARSALNTFRQLLVPRGLRQSGLSATAALSGYGIINGMALPILTFPTCLPSALAELLVPALTEAQMRGEQDFIRRSVKKLLRETFLFSLLFAAFFYFTADSLAWLVYKDPSAGDFIRVLAPILPFLYTDIVTDGCLKGLGQMMFSMAFNIAEAALGLLLVWALLPRWALNGYIFVLYICEIFNFALSLHRLYTITHKIKSPLQ